MISAPLRAPAIRLGAALMLCGSLALSGCGGSEEAPASFPPPDYSYLPKLRMNVATLTVVDHVQQAGPEPGDIAQTAPVPPDQALQRLAQDRLVAAGNSGSAVFTIDRASIVQGSTGALDGHLAVHLDIITANGGHAGYAEAHVSRQLVPGDPDAAGGTRRQLYDLDRQMMQDMNVELEFQVRRSLRDWLVDAGGAPLAGSVEQQSLPPPGSPGYPAPAGTSYPGAPAGTHVLSRRACRHVLSRRACRHVLSRRACRHDPNRRGPGPEQRAGCAGAARLGAAAPGATGHRHGPARWDRTRDVGAGSGLPRRCTFRQQPGSGTRNAAVAAA